MSAFTDKTRHHLKWKTISILGVKIDALSLDELLAEFRSSVEVQKPVVITNVNLHAINIAYSLPWFREFLNQSHVTFCDGIGIKFAARLTGQALSYRFTPPDFISCICELAAQLHWKIFFLGAKPGTAQRAADRMVQKFPSLNIKVHHGYFDKSINSHENQFVIEQINDFKPQILVLGFGMPLQEKWMLENLPLLKVGVAMSAGALFDYLSGELPRAPRWITDNGLEWLARLVIEPRRLWKRYLIGNPLFFWRILFHHFLGYPLPK